MSGPKRNPDKLNTIGIVVVGICGAVLVYVTIVALQAFYMNDTSEIQTMADYGGQEMTAKDHKAAEMGNIPDIHRAMQEVVEAAKADPSHMVPSAEPATKPTIEPVFGRPIPLPATPAPAPAGAGSGSAAEPAKADGKAANADGKADKAEGKADKAEKAPKAPKADKNAKAPAAAPKAPAAGATPAAGGAPHGH